MVNMTYELTKFFEKTQLLGDLENISDLGLETSLFEPYWGKITKENYHEKKAIFDMYISDATIMCLKLLNTHASNIGEKLMKFDFVSKTCHFYLFQNAKSWNDCLGATFNLIKVII